MALPVLAILLAAAAAGGVVLAQRLPEVRLPPWSAGLAALLTAGLVLVLGQATGLVAALWTVALILPLSALAAVDAATRTLPDLITLVLAALGLAYLWSSGADLTAPLIAAACLAGLGLAVDRLLPEAPLGAGDFLLLAAIILWLGLIPLLELAILTALFLWGQFFMRMLVMRARRVADAAPGLPLAPALALAAVALWLADLPGGAGAQALAP